MSYLENLKWRYATKQFDPSKKVKEDELEKLKEVINLAPTSYGLQLFQVKIITNKELKSKLRAVSWNQSQVEDCSHLLVFCNYTSYNESHIDDYLKRKMSVQKLPKDKLEMLEGMMKNGISQFSSEFYQSWTAKQCYIALGFLMDACAQMKIDACPMEGFAKDEYDKLLDLEKEGLSAAVVCPIGYRHSEDYYQNMVKVRKPNSELFKSID